MSEARQSSPDTASVELPRAGAMQLARERLQATGTIFIVLIVLLAWIALKNPNFADPAVFLNFVRRATPLMVLAAGQVFVIAIGGLDLSVGSTVTEGDPFGGPVAMRLGVGGSWSSVGGTRLG